jgi:hypothetical protein
MEFAAQRDGEPLFRPPEQAGVDDRWTDQLTADAVASISPVSMVGSMLGRLARALAARARFSLDRFSDVYLVTDGIAAHASRFASGDRIGFGISTYDRRLELTIGPFRTGSGQELRESKPVRHVGSALSLLSDEIEIRPVSGGESVRVVMLDRRRSTSGVSA